VVVVGQLADLDQKLAVLRECFAIDRNHPLADTIDVRAARRAEDDFEHLSFTARRGVHDAATALLWLQI
jgi:hypothetical protein